MFRARTALLATIFLALSGSLLADDATDWETCSAGAEAVAEAEAEAEADACSPWGRALEAWANAPTTRGARVLNLPAKGYYVTDRLDVGPPLQPPPPPAPVSTPAPYSEWQPPPSGGSGSGKILNKPPGNYNKDKFRPSPEYYPVGNQVQGPQRPQSIPSQYVPGNQQHAPSNPQYGPGPQYGSGNQPQAPNSQFGSGNQHAPGTSQYGPGNQQHAPGSSQYGPGNPQHGPANQQLNSGPVNSQYTGQQHTPSNPQQSAGNPHYTSTNSQYVGNQLAPSSQPPGHSQHHQATGSTDRVDAGPPRKEVSETDLYLLAAIEKLVRRADGFEKRLRKAEEALHLILLAKEPAPEPCLGNFTRVGSSCYWWPRVVGTEAAADWQTAAKDCRRRGAGLVELTRPAQRRQLADALQADPQLRNLDWWTGGLNPGLLWIWAGSARPVLPNATAANPSQTGSSATNPASQTGSSAANTPRPGSGATIPGEGRCLALVWDEQRQALLYRGQDCALRHRYICEQREDSDRVSNHIERAARRLRGGGGARQARLLPSSGEE